MAKKEEKKGLFGGVFSSRDEKKEIDDLQAELAKTKKEAEAAKQAFKNLMAKKVEAKQDTSEELKAAEKRLTSLKPN